LLKWREANKWVNAEVDMTGVADPVARAKLPVRSTWFFITAALTKKPQESALGYKAYQHVPGAL
jgi:hypothetical protein